MKDNQITKKRTRGKTNAKKNTETRKEVTSFKERTIPKAQLSRSTTYQTQITVRFVSHC